MNLLNGLQAFIDRLSFLSEEMDHSEARRAALPHVLLRYHVLFSFFLVSVSRLIINDMIRKYQHDSL